ncbi:nucleotidyltransferase [Bacillus spongiae]|uniref:Nucleotidyltransferase n=1 Tax=Bacillus spongiae TaxID=2683610 RepID=A0ABU8HCI6_9BACI
MTRIKNIGRYCPVDDDGYIMNDSNTNKIQPEFYRVIENVVEIYKRHLGEDLHSVYIRGSVPRGLGIHGVSDLDTIAITNKMINDHELNWTEAEHELNQQFDCVDGVEFSFYFIEDVLNNITFSIIPFMIKTHSVCVFGEDIKKLLPEYKADKSLANDHLIILKRQIDQAITDLTGNEDREDIVDCCRWIMKIIVRAGLALVIEEENLYTRDLFPAYKIFSTYYPEKEKEMQQALHYAIAPVGNVSEIIDFLNEMGSWMVIQSDKWLQIYNPKKVRHLEI